MSQSKKNVDLTTNGFAGRLRALREAARLSKSDLAELAGLTYRTVHDLEAGKRERSQQKTILMLAQALDVTLEELLCGPPADAAEAVAEPAARRRVRFGAVFAAILVFLVAGFAVAWQVSRVHSVWELDQGRLVVKDSMLGAKLWALDQRQFAVSACMVSPWRNRNLLVATTRHADGGGRVLCLDRASGDTIWAVGPDREALIRAFSSEVVLAAEFSCMPNWTVANLDGDGIPEVISLFVHGKYYPSALCVIDHDGNVRWQYANKGHLQGILVTDLDDDGRDEIIVTGVTNNKPYTGATVIMLDGRHCGGASVDLMTEPPSNEPDQSLYRLVLPNFPAPYMRQLSAKRLSAYDPQLCMTGTEEALLSVSVQTDDPLDATTVYLDSELRPVRAEANDSFLQHSIADWPDSLTSGTGPTDPEWMTTWLGTHLRFASGQLLAE